MEMEDHHHHHHHHHNNNHHNHHQHHEQQQQYGITDLRQLVNSGPRFPSMPPHSTAELFPGGHPNLAATQHYEMMMFGRQVADIMPRCLHDFASTDSATTTTNNNNTSNNTNMAVATTPTTTSVSTPPLSCLEAETAGCIGGDASTGRWPRQETLTLLEIRSRLDSKFKEANQKGPLWDEVSRIMSEEHGYQRSGKKCREKFENLYKYYKKTKEGKAGRQDGKHYRFFRQLEALYGENSNQVSLPETNFGSSSLRFHSHNPSSQTNQENFQSSQKHCDSLSLTNSTDLDTSSSDNDNDQNSTGGLNKDNNDSMEKRRKRRSWKVKIKDFIDSQMRKLVDKQEEWLDKLTKTLEQKEKERVLREEEWRRQEAARLEREHKFWAQERAWIEARDAALMEALQKLTGNEVIRRTRSPEGIMVTAIQNENKNEDGSEILNSTTVRGAESWPESEITRLQQLRAEMETRYMQQGGCSEEVMWEEIATKMACFGYERSALVFKEKWESNYARNTSKDGNKKRKEDSRGCFYFDNSDQSSLYNQGGGGAYCDINDQRHETGRLQSNDGSSPSNSNVRNAVAGDNNCFPFLMTEGGNLWENYSLKVNEASQN